MRRRDRTGDRGSAWRPAGDGRIPGERGEEGVAEVRRGHRPRRGPRAPHPFLDSIGNGGGIEPRHRGDSNASLSARHHKLPPLGVTSIDTPTSSRRVVFSRGPSSDADLPGINRRGTPSRWASMTGPESHQNGGDTVTKHAIPVLAGQRIGSRPSATLPSVKRVCRDLGIPRHPSISCPYHPPDEDKLADTTR